MLHLRQLDLQLALVGTGALRKNIENQPGAIDDSSIQRLFEIALLGRTQSMIDEHDLGAGVVEQLPQLLHLASTEEKARINLTKRCSKGTGDFGAGRQGQGVELLPGFSARCVAQSHMNEDGPLAVARSVKQIGTPCPTRRYRQQQVD